MKLIAKKPCSFGGQQFFIGDEIPVEFVADAKQQEYYGLLAITNSDEGVPEAQSGTCFSQEQVDAMIADALAEVEQKHADELSALEQSVAELKEVEPGAYDGTVTISIKGEGDGENAQFTAVPVTLEELQTVFSIMQLNADEGSKAIAEVKEENVLVLIHAADSRKTIKEAAKKQADNLFSTNGVKNEATNGNETTGTNTEGADT